MDQTGSKVDSSSKQNYKIKYNPHLVATLPNMQNAITIHQIYSNSKPYMEWKLNYIKPN